MKTQKYNKHTIVLFVSGYYPGNIFLLLVCGVATSITYSVWLHYGCFVTQGCLDKKCDGNLSCHVSDNTEVTNRILISLTPHINKHNK